MAFRCLLFSNKQIGLGKSDPEIVNFVRESFSFNFHLKVDWGDRKFRFSQTDLLIRKKKTSKSH
jgi:hypothetical protein